MRAAKRIVRIDENNKTKEYKSLKDASNQTNIKQANISNVCNGRQKTSGGYKWEYKDTELNDISDTVYRLDIKTNIVKKYKDYSAVLKDNNITPKQLMDVCDGIINNIDGYMFFEEECWNNKEISKRIKIYKEISK